MRNSNEANQQQFRMKGPSPALEVLVDNLKDNFEAYVRSPLHNTINIAGVNSRMPKQSHQTNPATAKPSSGRIVKPSGSGKSKQSRNSRKLNRTPLHANLAATGASSTSRRRSFGTSSTKMNGNVTNNESNNQHYTKIEVNTDGNDENFAMPHNNLGQGIDHNAGAILMKNQSGAVHVNHFTSKSTLTAHEHFGDDISNHHYKPAAPPGVPPPQPPPSSPGLDDSTAFVSAATFAATFDNKTRPRSSKNRQRLRGLSRTRATNNVVPRTAENHLAAARASHSFRESASPTPDTQVHMRKNFSPSPINVPDDDQDDACMELTDDDDDDGIDERVEEDTVHFSYKPRINKNIKRSGRRATRALRREWMNRDLSPSSLAERDVSSPVEPEITLDADYSSDDQGLDQNDGYEDDESHHENIYVVVDNVVEHDSSQRHVYHEEESKGEVGPEQDSDFNESDSDPEEDSVAEANQIKLLLENAKQELELGNTDAAFTLVDPICNQDNVDADTLFLRSSIHMACQRYATCHKDCLRALELDPHHTKAAIRAARMLRTMGCFSVKADWLRVIGNDDGILDQARNELESIEKASALFESITSRISRTPGDASIDDLLCQLVNLCAGWPCVYLLQGIQACCKGDKAAMDAHINKAYQFVADVETIAMDANGCFLGKSVEITNCGKETAKAIKTVLRSLHYADYVQESTTFANGLFKRFADLPADKILLVQICEQQVRTFARLQEAKDAANNLFRTKNYSRAISKYTEALNIDPGHDRYNAVILSNRAAAYMANEDFENAVKDCTLALEKLETYTKARVRRARANVKLGKPKLAMNDLERAIAEDPQPEYEVELENLRAEARRQREAKSEAHSQARWGKYERKKHSNASSTSSAAKSRFGANTCLYKVLDIPETASQEQIRKAYLKLALKYHPDKRGANDAEAVEIFKCIAEAYETLKDPVKKAEYDRKRSFNNRFSPYFSSSRATSGSSASYYYAYF